MKIVMCTACHRQYDASLMPKDTLLRCLCGQAVAVEELPPHEPRALRCSSCGAPFQNDDQKCGHCHAETTIEERMLSAVCPGCGARMSEEAKHCMECGLGIAVQKIAPLRWDAKCPRCESELRHRSVEDRLDLIECSSCAGIWLEPDSFRGVVRESKRKHFVGEGRHDESKPELDRHEMRYLPCPVCAERMMPRGFGKGSGIMLDVCREHGVWFDHRELEAVTRWVETHGEVTDVIRKKELNYGRDGASATSSLPPSPAPDPRSRGSKSSPWDVVDVFTEVIGDLFNIG